MSSTKFRRAGVLAAGLALTVAVSGSVQPAWSAPNAPAPAPVAATALVAEPTELATDEDKVEAARALGINPGIDMLVLNDQDYVLALWRQAKDGSLVKAEALRAYDTTDSGAAYAFITTGIFDAAQQDALAEIMAAHAKALRRSAAVTVGLDAADTALIDLGDRDFIFAVWQRVKDGSHVKAAAQAAIAEGTGPDDWTAFLTTGAAAARELDILQEIEDSDGAAAERLRAEQLANAKKSLLQLLLLPVTEELVNAPSRQYVLHVLANAKGTEVKLAAQAAVNAADLEKALSDFIFTGGSAANTKDEAAAAAKELAGYRSQVTAIRDTAKLDGLQANLVAAANQALTTGTLLALQTFLLKGQDAARVLDRKAHATVVLAGDRIGVLAADGAVYVKEGTTPGSGTWVRQYGGVKQLVVSGTRIGVVTYDGTAYVKDGTVASTGWVRQYAGIKQLALNGTRIGVLTNDGTAYVKDGTVASTGWVKAYTSARQIALSGTRIGVITTSGTPLVKEGGLSAAWDEQNFGTPVKSLVLEGTRVGIISDYGTSWLKDGAINTNNWVKQKDFTINLALSGTRVGFIERPSISVPEHTIPENGPGTPWVKDGTPAATNFVDVRANSRDAIRLVLAGDRIAVLVGAGTVYVKEGAVSASWVAVRTIGGL